MPDLRGVGRVEYVQLRVAGLGAEGFGEDLRAEARATHAEQQHILEPGALNVVCEVLEMRNPLQLFVNDVKPAEPVGFVRLGPQRGVGGP